jgi:hypothetical protein
VQTQTLFISGLDMPIFHGSTEITDIKHGNTEINSVWHGGTQVWSRGYTLTLDYDTQYTEVAPLEEGLYYNTNYAGYSNSSTAQPIDGSINPSAFSKSPLVNSSQSTPSIDRLYTYERAGSGVTDTFVLILHLDRKVTNSGWTNMTIQRLYNGAPTGSVFTYGRTNAAFLSGNTTSLWQWNLYYSIGIFPYTAEYDPFNNTAGTEYEIKFT